MKFLIIFSLTFIFFVTVFFVGIFSPYFIYFQSISKGFSSNLLSIAPNSQAFIIKMDFEKKKIKEFLPENEKSWKVFHFTNFEIPLPVENPVVQLYPRIDSLGKIEYYGGFLNNYKDEKYFSFVEGRNISFEFPFDKQKIFDLPVFKNFLEKIPKEKMFELVFSKDLDFKNLDTTKKIKLLQRLWTISYQELILNLFILQIRNDIFPKDIKGFSWFAEKGYGVIELSDINPGFYKEIIFMLIKDKIYTIEWRLPEKELLSDNIRFRFLNTLKFKKTFPEATISSYNDYRSLPLAKKLTPTGFTILYSGLSHDPSDQNFLKLMARDMKKGGKENEKYLEWIYSYGQKKFNLDLKVDQNLLNNAKIEKEKSEKLEAEIREANRLKLRSPSSQEDPDNISKEEKVELFLKDAKEKGEELEDNEKIMIEN